MKQGAKENIDGEPKVEDRIQSALNILYKIVRSYKPRNCKIIADGKDFSGKYLMVEVMNAKSIGPNLIIASEADVGDGQFELVLIPAEKREDLASYVQTRMEGKEIAFEFPTIRAKQLSLTWKGKDAHMDDELVGMQKSKKVFIEPRRGLLQFMVPKQ
jgi:diacylglycerol kinase family enzyme